MKKRIFSIITAICVVAVLILGGCEPSKPTIVDTPVPTQPTDAPPTDTSPTDTTPTDTSPTGDTTPADTTPTDTSPTGDTTPTDTSPNGDTTTPTDTPAQPTDTPAQPTTTPLPDTTTTPPPVVITTTTTTTTITDSSVPIGSGPVLPPTPPTPKIISPAASGTKVSTTNKSTIDYSNTSDGYIMLKYTGDRARVILQIITPNNITYQFRPPADTSWRAFPLSEGNGSYTIKLFDGAEGTTAVSPVDEIKIDVKITDPNKPFLMTNFFVNYTANSTVVTKAVELCTGKTTDIDKITAIYNWFVDNIKYDHDKAATVKSGYIPNLTELMRDKKGICSDYAAGMAAMLRCMGIPAKVEEGWAGTEYHAWINVFTKETGWVNGWIRFDGSKWSMMEPTWAAMNKDTNQSFRNFVLGGNHDTLFSY